MSSAVGWPWRQTDYHGVADRAAHARLDQNQYFFCKWSGSSGLNGLLQRGRSSVVGWPWRQTDCSGVAWARLDQIFRPLCSRGNPQCMQEILRCLITSNHLGQSYLTIHTKQYPTLEIILKIRNKVVVLHVLPVCTFTIEAPPNHKPRTSKHETRPCDSAQSGHWLNQKLNWAAEEGETSSLIKLVRLDFSINP